MNILSLCVPPYIVGLYYHHVCGRFSIPFYHIFGVGLLAYLSKVMYSTFVFLSIRLIMLELISNVHNIWEIGGSEDQDRTSVCRWKIPQ